MTNIASTYVAGIFEQASRQALRFETSRGELTVEDLWGLDLTSARGRPNLDDIGRGIRTQLKEHNQDNESLVDDTNSSDNALKNELDLKFSVVKHIIAVLKAENAAKASEKARRQERKDLLDLLHDAEKAELSKLTPDEIRAKIASLGDA